ncbi:MAG: AGE family epimerase/isomerase [Balneolaceae bacterium]|nr:AGE family epimerase/isomerase [Balneolaceae bacterium]
MPDSQDIHSLKTLFEQELFENIIPFWETHSPDRKHGGYYNCLDREGRVFDTTKHVWLQGRQAWMFSKLYNQHQARPEWLEIARNGINFLRNHAIRPDKRLYFSLTEKGQPVWIQRKIFSECFYIIALAEFSRAADEPYLMEEAEEQFEIVWNWSKDLSQLGRPVLEGQIPSRSLAIPMILLNVIEELTSGTPARYVQEIEECIRQILLHVHADKQTVFETVGKDGQFLDTMEGRLLNPGHAIEAGWFLHQWAAILNDDGLQQTAISMIRWSHERGWDQKHGGLFYFLDYKGHSPTQLEWFMKLWWPHNEAMIAHLINYSVTGEQMDWDLFKKVQEYSFRHFPDNENGEWFGYMNREGEVTHSFKGGPYKGFFHVPRSLWTCFKLLEKLEN